MATPKKKPSTKTRVREHRDRLRAQGLRPVQIWVPDVRSKEFVRQAHLQSVAVAQSEHSLEDQRFIDEITDDL